MSDEGYHLIDDSSFKELSRRLIEGHEEEAASQSGLDVDAVLHRRRQRREKARLQMEEGLSAASREGWLDFQFLPLPGWDLKAVVRIQATGIAAVDSLGRAEWENQFLFLVEPGAGERPEGAIVYCLTHITPLWHPQVSAEGQVVITSWSPENWLELAETLRDLVQFRKYNVTDFVLNGEAAQWAATHKTGPTADDLR